MEVLAASVVIAVALAPALRLTRAAVLTADRLDRQERCLTVANDRVEFLMASAAADWDGTVTGTLAGAPAGVPGYAGLEALHVVTDAAAGGGIPGRLAAIRVLVWDDADADGTLNPGEPQVVLDTAVARMTAYEQHAAP